MSDACQRTLRRIHEVNEQDSRRQREREAIALSTTNAQYIAELGDLAFMLRDIVDGVERDTLEALFDEGRFGDIKRAAGKKIVDLCRPYEPKARSAQVLDEFVRLREAVARTVAALPFPKDLFIGFAEATFVCENSFLGSIEPFAEAVTRQDWRTAFEIATSMGDKLSMEAVAEQVARIMDDRLRRLKNSYTNWWKANSRALQERLTEFHRALLREQTRLAQRVTEGRDPDAV